MKTKHVRIILYLFFLPISGFAQAVIQDVPITLEQVVLNDKVMFSIASAQKMDSILVFDNVIKPEAGMQLVVVKLNYTGKIATKFIVRPNDFVAMYGDFSVYMVPSIAVGPGGSWISNELEQKLGKMSLTINVVAGLNKDEMNVAFKLPKTVNDFSVMSKTISSVGNISIPE